MDRVFSGFDKIESPGFKTWALPRTLIDFYYFIDLLGQAGCTIVVLDIDVDANIAQLVWLKLWAMFKLLPIYLRSPIGFCAPLHTIVCFPLKEKYSTQKICHPLIIHIYVQFKF